MESLLRADWARRIPEVKSKARKLERRQILISIPSTS
jgi:hypothetical protein